MKKKYLAYLFLIIAGFISAQTYDGEPLLNIEFSNPTISENINTALVNSNAIRNKFEKIFREYTTMTVTDSNHESQIAKYQVEHNLLGSLETASSIAFIDLQKTGANTILIFKVTSAKTSTVIANDTYTLPQDEIYDEEKLDRAIGTVSANVLQTMGVPLSEANRARLRGQKSSDEISSEDINSEILQLEVQLAALQNEISGLQGKKSEADINKIHKLQIQQSKLEKKREVERLRYERKLKDEERKEEERSKAAKRTEAQNKIIQSQTEKYERYAKMRRNLILQSMNAVDQIGVAERNKQTIVAMRQEKELSIKNFKALERKNAQDDCAKIDNEPYSIVETDANGQPIEKAVAERQEKKNKIETAAAARMAAYEQKLEKEHAVFEKNLLAEINGNYRIMGKKTAVNSIDNAECIRLRVENYDGQQYGWFGTVSFDMNGSNIIDYPVFIPYRNLLNKKPNYSSQEYRETVEEYDSYFRNHIPVVYAAVEYYIEPLERDKPSQYAVKILKTTLYKIDTDAADAPPKKIVTKTEKGVEGYYTAAVISDIRTEDERLADLEKARKNSEKEMRDAEKRALTAARKERTNKVKQSSDALEDSEDSSDDSEDEESSLNKDSFIMPVRYNGIEVGIQTSKFNFDTSRLYASFAFPLWPFFMGFETTLWESPNAKDSKKSIKNVFDTGSALNMNYGMQLGIHFNGIRFLLSPYLYASGGLNYDFPTKTSAAYVGGSIGFHVFSIFGLNYTYEYNINRKSSRHFVGASFGIHITRTRR